MKVQSVITTEVSLDAIYSLCTPLDKKKCIKAIRFIVNFQITMMTDPNGGWLYPDEGVIAEYLIEHGLAISVDGMDGKP